MADEHTKGDMLGLFLTFLFSIEVDIGLVGVLAPPFADEPDSIDPDDSLGGYRSSIRAKLIGFYINDPIPGVVIERVAGENGEGAGSLEAVDGDSLRWTAPGGEPGDEVAISNGETKLLESGNSEISKFIIVSRQTAADLTGNATVILVPVYNNAIGSSNAANTTEVKLRCVAFKNEHAADDAKNLAVWLNTLGTQQVSNQAQLPGAGAGTIETSSSFSDWPNTGFCRIETAVDVLREIVYYSSRTDTELTVPAVGRELLETTAAAGAANDKIYPVPGIKIAKEDPLLSIADDENDTAAVAGFAWETGITDSTGLDIGNLTAGQEIGLWIWLIILEGQTATPNLENAIQWNYSHGAGAGEIFLDNKGAGRYRVSDDSIEGYELYRGIGEEPDLSLSPWETFATLPHETAALAFSQIYNFVLRERNKFNLVSQNIDSWRVELDGSGDEVEPDPEAPQNISIAPAADGTGLVEAQYFYDEDDDYAATDWLIYFTDDGVNPDPGVDSPTVVAMNKSGGMARLEWTSSVADNGDTLKVLVRTRRTSVENYDSDNTDIYSCTADTEGPDLPGAKVYFGRAAETM